MASPLPGLYCLLLHVIWEDGNYSWLMNRDRMLTAGVVTEH